MNTQNLELQVNHLLDTLEAQESAIYDLGTPQLVESDPVKQLIVLGSQNVPYLLSLLTTVNAKRAAWLALVLGKLRDRRALEPLRELRATYERRDSKTTWDYAVIGQSRVAIDLIERSQVN